MKAAGIHSIKESTKNHIWRKLSDEFGDSLRFLTNKNVKVLVFCRNISFHLVKENHKLNEEIRLLRSDRESIDTAIKKSGTSSPSIHKRSPSKYLMVTTSFRITRWSIFHTRLTTIAPTVFTDR